VMGHGCDCKDVGVGAGVMDAGGGGGAVWV
jgi:hypothetical protein